MPAADPPARHNGGHFSVVADPHFPVGVIPCNTSQHPHLKRLRWEAWTTGCTPENGAGSTLCYRWPSHWSRDPPHVRTAMDMKKDNQHVFSDWFNIEQVMFDRWEVSPFNCYQSAGCAAEADAVIVPSPLAACYQEGASSTREGVGESGHGLHKRFWANLQLAYPRESQLLVLHTVSSCDTDYNIAMRATLATEPDAFVRRVVVVGMDSPVSSSALCPLPNPFRVPPAYVVVPSPIHTLGYVDASLETRPRPFVAMFEGRRNNPQRQMVFRELRHARGSMCTCLEGMTSLDDGPCPLEVVTFCTVCAHEVDLSTCERLHNEIVRASGGMTAAKSLSLATHSTFCIQPASDAPTRPDLYAAILGGCVPVLLERAEDPEVEWAWRRLVSGFEHTPGAAQVQAATNYSAFSEILPSDELEVLMRGTERTDGASASSSSHGIRSAGRLMARLGAKASDLELLRPARQALRTAAPYLRYAEPHGAQSSAKSAGRENGIREHHECVERAGGAPCDAFSLFVRTLQVLSWRLKHNVTGAS
jgi:hypothetical protein